MARARNANAPRRRHADFLNAFSRLLSVGIALAVIVMIAFWFYPELKKRTALVAQLDQEKAELQEEELLHKKQERQVHLLETNKEYLETIARDKLDLMKEGETIFRLDGSKSPQAAPMP